MKESEQEATKITRAQAVWRKSARKILHYPLLNTLESIDNFGGLEKLCEYVGQKKAE